MGHKALLDDNKRLLGLPPQSIQTIAADTAITWKAITPIAASAGAYFTNNTSGTATIEAGTTILVHEDLRLGTETDCWVY